MILALLGCGVLDDAPRIDAINGVATKSVFGEVSWPGEVEYVPGEDATITVEVSDAQGEAVSLWWPAAPPGWEFPSDAREGVWHVPEGDTLAWYITLVAEDAGGAASTLNVTLSGPRGDTGEWRY